MKKLITLATILIALYSCAPTFAMQKDHISFMGLSQKESKPALCLAVSALGFSYYGLQYLHTYLLRFSCIAFQDGYRANISDPDDADQAVKAEQPQINDLNQSMLHAKRGMCAFGALAVSSGVHLIAQRYGYIS